MSPQDLITPQTIAAFLGGVVAQLAFGRRTITTALAPLVAKVDKLRALPCHVQQLGPAEQKASVPHE
jgi:hypothetical protein